jgi:hypothetical protein
MATKLILLAAWGLGLLGALLLLERMSVAAKRRSDSVGGKPSVPSAGGRSANDSKAEN